jgi:hypothetical protein
MITAQVRVPTCQILFFVSIGIFDIACVLSPVCASEVQREGRVN